MENILWQNKITAGYSAEITESWSGKGAPSCMGPERSLLPENIIPTLPLIHQTLIILFFGIDASSDGWPWFFCIYIMWKRLKLQVGQKVSFNMILTYFLWCRPPGDISSGAHISLSAPFFYTESFHWVCVQHVAQNGQWNTVKIRSDKTLSTRQVLKSTSSLCLCENFPKRAVTRQQWRMRLKTEKLNLGKQSVDLFPLLVLLVL